MRGKEMQGTVVVVVVVATQHSSGQALQHAAAVVADGY